FENDSFDFIFGNAVLHHVTLERIVPEIARVLKKGEGRILRTIYGQYCHKPHAIYKA
ncbi:MAG: methyltransferase domain-containing protein, partial [Nitrospirae bacterium]|nr:methyltransferase domain-containing protein [Nitrospirota bacterium]